MTDEMMEDLAKQLRDDGIDCRTVHEWIDGVKQKTRKIEDYEVRRFLLNKKNQGDVVVLITKDYDSWKQVGADELPVIYVNEVIREHVLKREGK